MGKNPKKDGGDTAEKKKTEQFPAKGAS